MKKTMKRSKAKKPAAKKAKSRKAAPKKRATVRAKVKVKAKVKAKGKPKRVTPKARKAKKGLSIAELFALKKQKEQEAANNGGDWNHKKDLPPQASDSNDLHAKVQTEGKKSGFGGSRHH